MLNFCPRHFRACQLTARIGGIDGIPFLGTARHPWLTPGCTPLHSQLGISQVSLALSLMCTNYSNIYLGSNTAFVAWGASPVSLTPGRVGVKTSPRGSCVHPDP